MELCSFGWKSQTKVSESIEQLQALSWVDVNKNRSLSIMTLLASPVWRVWRTPESCRCRWAQTHRRLWACNLLVQSAAPAGHCLRWPGWPLLALMTKFNTNFTHDNEILQVYMKPKHTFRLRPCCHLGRNAEFRCVPASWRAEQTVLGRQRRGPGCFWCPGESRRAERATGAELCGPTNKGIHILNP